jgi:hypothetical protein
MIKEINTMSIRKLAAGIASAALLGGGALAVAATSASAAVAAPASLVAYHPAPSPDQLKLQFEGNTYTYNVNLREVRVAPGTELVFGMLRDSYEPHAINLPVDGVQFGNDVVISVQYPSTGPDAGNQGVRTFSGVVGPHGHVTGSWSETGTEAGSGAFTLDRI